jgi:hypothetical protein
VRKVSVIKFWFSSRGYWASYALPALNIDAQIKKIKIVVSGAYKSKMSLDE